MRLTLAFDLLKLFGVHLLTVFRKLDCFTTERLFLCDLKRSSLHKRVSKYNPERFNEIGPWLKLNSIF
jgi:hypothetical protein